MLQMAGFSQTIGNSHVTVIKNVNPQPTQGYGGIWGWTASNGKEFVILPSANGGVINFWDITGNNVNNPVSMGTLPNVKSEWQELKTYDAPNGKSYCYKISDVTGDDIYIINITPMATGGAPVMVKKFSNPGGTNIGKTMHTLWIDAPKKLMYLNGADHGSSATQGKGLLIMDITDPENPKQISRIGIEAHDSFPFGNYLYAQGQWSHFQKVYDVSTPATPVLKSTIDFCNYNATIGEPAATAYGGATTPIAHSVVTVDGHYMYYCEETVGSSVKVFDISDPANQKIVARLPMLKDGKRPVIAHNPFIDPANPRWLLIAGYTAGMHLYDLQNPAAPVEVAYFDPSSATVDFDGIWGAYMNFKSGVYALTDMTNGLYLVKPDATVIPTTAGYSKGFPQFAITGFDSKQIRFSLPKADAYDLSIFNPMGESVYSAHGNADGGMQTLTLDHGNLVTGNYFVKVRQDADSHTATISLRN